MKFIRIGKMKWMEYHVWLWKVKHKKKVPKGKILTFKDGNPMHCTIRNLELSTKAESAARTREMDGYIAMTLSRKSGSKGIDRAVYNEVMKNKPLLELKRQQLRMQRALRSKEHGK